MTTTLPHLSMSLLEKFTHWMFRFRTPLVCVFAILPAVRGWFAFHLRVDASFHKSLPLAHEYIRTYVKHERAFGGANRVLVALQVRNGDMFTPQFFAQLKQVTDEVAFLPAVDRAQVYSLWTP